MTITPKLHLKFSPKEKKQYFQNLLDSFNTGKIKLKFDFFYIFLKKTVGKKNCRKVFKYFHHQYYLIVQISTNEFINGHIHLSHSFIIYAFSPKTARDHRIFNDLILQCTPPVRKGRILKVSKAPGSASRNVRRAPYISMSYVKRGVCILVLGTI